MEDGFARLCDKYESKLRVLHSVDGPIKDISVKELCKSCGISQATFYRYFESRNLFYVWYQLLCGTIAIDEIGRSFNWHDGLRYHLRLLSRERKHLQLIAMRESDFDVSFMERRRAEIMRETLAMHGVEITPLLDVQMKSYLHVEEWLVPEWIRSGMSLDADSFATQIESIVPRELHDIFDRPLSPPGGASPR